MSSAETGESPFGATKQ